MSNKRTNFDREVIIIPNISGLDPKDALREDVILSGLKEISDKYEADLDRRANEYAKQSTAGSFDSDEEILGQAKESLDALYGEKKSKAQSGTTRKIDDLKEDLQDAADSYAHRQKKLRDRYEKSWDDTLESFAKKGTSHSSAAVLSKAKLQSDYEEDRAYLEGAARRKAEAIDRKIERLNESYEQALRNYEITYAIELEKKVASLTKKRDKLMEDWNKEHRDERQEAFKEYKEAEAARNKEYELAEGDYEGSKKQNYLERYDYLLSQLEGKNKPRIASFIAKYEKQLKEYLGLYYDKFLEEVS